MNDTQLTPQPHEHYCAACGSLWRCDVPACAYVDDLICYECEEA